MQLCMQVECVCYVHVGCWFGVKGDDKLGVFIRGVKQCAVNVCTNAEPRFARTAVL